MSVQDKLVRFEVRSRVSALAALCASTAAFAQTYAGSDSVFATTSWTVTVVAPTTPATGSASQVVNGYQGISNAWRSGINPTNSDAWTISIFEGFSYDPSLQPGTPSAVEVSFDSRWVNVNHSRVGPAVRQGTTIWAGAHPLNTPNWTPYAFSGWSTILSGATGPALDFSETAAPIFFGFYQRNGGDATGRQTEFANFQVSVTAPTVPAAPVSWLLFPVARASRRRRA